MKHLHGMAGAMIGLTIIGGALFGWLVGLKHSGPVKVWAIRHVEGQLYSASLPVAPFPLSSLSDSVSRPYDSPLRLFENDRALGPAHTVHATIRHLGGGTFSHWNGTLLFSARDNSDPTSNGRVYLFVTRVFLRGWIAAIMIVFGGVLCWSGTADLRRELVAAGAQRGANPLVRFIGRKLIAARATGIGAWQYGLFLCLPAGILFVAVGEWTAPRTTAALGANYNLTDRVAAYLEEPEPYSAVFLGDSRTYCDVHPELLEPLVPGLHALNLSNFSNWFPTQLALIREIVQRIPPRTLVVWSIGHGNFSGIGSGTLSVQRVYPIGFLDAARLMWWNYGRAPQGLFDNLSYYQPPLHAFVAARELHGAFEAALKRPIISSDKVVRIAYTSAAHAGTAQGAPGAMQEDKLSAAARALEQRARSDPDVTAATATVDEGRITSIIRYFRRGGYHRTEIDPDYFRAKQNAMGYKPLSDAEANAYNTLPPGALEWRVFLSILDIFSQRGTRLVVNELEEAGFVYGHPLVRSKWRKMMRDLVQPEIERRGFTYMRTNLDALADDDYFDWNHMNSKGVGKYTIMLAQRLNELTAGR
jgi:hypothetical protein